MTEPEKDRIYLSDSKYYNSIIRVGRDYQADLPQLRSNKNDTIETVNYSEIREDKLLWNPSAICSKSLKRFLSAIKSTARSKMDEERVLFLLHQCEYDINEAYRRFQLLPTPSNTGGNWTEEECKLFERVLQLYGKKFDHVQKLVPNRSVQEIVEFYYFWKRSERYDTFITDKSIHGQSRYKKKTRKKVYRSIDPADAILDKEFVRNKELIYGSTYVFHKFLSKLKKARETLVDFHTTAMQVFTIKVGSSYKSNSTELENKNSKSTGGEIDICDRLKVAEPLPSDL